MDFRQLKYFLAVVDTGGFSAAARFLGMAQPPISIQVRLLEEELGVRLFERTPRGVILTPAGSRLVPEARALLERLTAVRDEVRHAASGLFGAIRLGISQNSCWSDFGTRLRKFRRRHRGLTISIVQIPDTRRCPEDLDAIIVRLPTLEPPADAILLKDVVSGVGVHPKHRLAGRAEATAPDLIGETLLFGEDECALERSLRLLFPSSRFNLRSQGSLSWRLWMAKADCGVVPCGNTDIESSGYKLAFVPFASGSQFAIYWVPRADTVLAESVSLLGQALKEVADPDQPSTQDDRSSQTATNERSAGVTPLIRDA